MRTLFGLMAVVAVVGGAGAAQAQTPVITSKPIDAEALVIRPVAATSGVVGNTVNFVSRVTADVIDNNAIVRTVNNLFGRKSTPPPTTQGGLSPLPHPSQYSSSYYNSPIKPVFPTFQVIRR